MPPESALLESRALRESLAARTGVLDKVKVLAMLPDGLHVTTRMVAEYFEVSHDTVKTLVKRHRGELSSHGLRTLRGSELRFFERSTLDPSEGSYPQGRVHLTLFTRRTVLNAAMLLRDSEVARAVRRYLLDAEEEAGRAHREAVGDRPSPERSLEARMTVAESCLADVGAALRDLGPVLRRTSDRLDRIDERLDGMDRRIAFMDRRLDHTNQVVCAMSERMAGMDVRLRQLREETARCPRPRGGRR
ncbi:hypothetical protein LIX60_15080 [Streptomyces sp. S07_1.15]|uniref:hypothetical protein n=1 Tax=Streptomyces sp. S07_1.15 TaxID=2873925 RepID=UPI001D133B53|nr:hypothetical protein [Streptomyces sp. S07_1.15]MCC3652761.1 hypothetical protein [Streptomyces sp. S07_1.15]